MSIDEEFSLAALIVIIAVSFGCIGYHLGKNKASHCEEIKK